MPEGPSHYTQANRLTGMAHSQTYGDGADPVTGGALAQEATAHAVNGLTAMVKALADVIADATNVRSADLDAWDDVIPPAPRKECWSKDQRRPACEERHTEDCQYTDPIPEPPHKLLPVGTRVLVSERAVKHPDGRIVYDKQPKAAKIIGYDMGRTKYEINEERIDGGYWSVSTWAFVDNRVQPHPEQDSDAVNAPTGPRVYVKNHRGKDGYVVEFERKKDDPLAALVQWHTMGMQPVWQSMDRLTIIHADDVSRCPNGQTGLECMEIDPCEMCQQDSDAEGDEIEESMGLR